MRDYAARNAWVVVKHPHPNRRSLEKPEIHDFWEIQHCISTDRGLVLMDRRNVMFKSLRGKIIHCWHSAYQRVGANDSVYWPDMNVSTCNFRANYLVCYSNTDLQGSLDNDRVTRAILQYCNTLFQGIGLSSAQLLFYHQLYDFLHNLFSTSYIMNG